jgi:hypothetical protein
VVKRINDAIIRIDLEKKMFRRGTKGEHQLLQLYIKTEGMIEIAIQVTNKRIRNSSKIETIVDREVVQPMLEVAKALINKETP